MKSSAALRVVALLGRHSLETRKVFIHDIPYLTAGTEYHFLGFEAAGIIQACCMNYENIGCCVERHVDGRSTCGTEGSGLNQACVASDVPMSCIPLKLDGRALPEREIGPVPGAAFLLAMAALAVKHRNRFRWNSVSNCTAGAAASIGLNHYGTLLTLEVAERQQRSFLEEASTSPH